LLESATQRQAFAEEAFDLGLVGLRMLLANAIPTNPAGEIE
jgi:hypothetical protein